MVQFLIFQGYLGGGGLWICTECSGEFGIPQAGMPAGCKCKIIIKKNLGPLIHVIKVLILRYHKADSFLSLDRFILYVCMCLGSLGEVIPN